MTKTDPYTFVPTGLSHSLLFHLDAALRIITARAERIARSQLGGLTVRDCRIIQAANSKPALSQGPIADSLGINRNVMVLEVDSLEHRGYLKRERKPGNRREQTLVLTPKGKRLVEIIQKNSLQFQREAFHPLTTKDRAALMRWATSVIEHNT